MLNKVKESNNLPTKGARNLFFLTIIFALFLFSFGCTSSDTFIIQNKDYNHDLNIALPDLSAYVDWVDGNNTYVIKSDLNDLIPKIGDVNCINGDKVLGYVEGFSC